MTYFRRNNNSESPKNREAIVTLWVCPESLDEIEHYGDIIWHTDGVSDSTEGYRIVDIEDIYDSLEKNFPENKDCFNPRAIVETAGFWDNWDLVIEAWEKVLEPMRIGGIRTFDGLIIISDIAFACDIVESF